MSNMSICKCCGRTMDASFVFCPWCGTSKVSAKDSDSIDAFAQSVKDKKYYEQEQQIEEIGSKLEKLEQELSMLVLSAEMHK